MENPASPRKLAGRYEVRQILGQGGMGLVYRAYDTVVRREVAVKTILDIPDPASLQLFYKECDVLASMSHPNIVEIFDIGEFEEDGKKKPYFVMPLLPGTTLEYFIRKASHRLTVERTIDIMSQTCRGLQAAHERGLVHRYVNPSNILLTDSAPGRRRILLAGLGVARRPDETNSLTRANLGIGTVSYAAPEQLMDDSIDGQADQYALACTAFHLLTGWPPFAHMNPAVVISKHLNEAPPRPSDMNPELIYFDAPFARALMKAPAERFPQCREFAKALRRGAT